ncbi:hypothetical protein HN51_067746 [Arachis hypogaea]|uniref:Protein kinase domain-containing protein n=1 Tax=Arachis hypogaea TaxID=3818 RepID=A0A444ZQ34_ARAHY|nr:probable serine/threonine-protein kinase At1g54610 isoform X1 [Arachis ipaensis]XP_025649961.1 probable serine/threonine-protein kinase At1g54610 isoform X1 [Arachis hypogaea]QHO09212.1 putative serine/threonine-protein kinase [Arachis hypogaea]RYR16222.1 hypothetical protein Ahy_B04g073218 [Arachis hypogaea]
MGCVNSKKARAGDPSASPADDGVAYVKSYSRRGRLASGRVGAVVSSSPASRGRSSTSAVVAGEAAEVREGGGDAKRDEAAAAEKLEKKSSKDMVVRENGNGNNGGRGSSRQIGALNARIGLSHRFVEAESIAAGWPPWLTSVAGEAIHGMVPLKSDAFEKLDKIGQGTYSSVFQAREVHSGRMVALKKVRFDNFQPESIRFMAREIIILRALDHPNVMKLEGIITSQLSHSIYLVFEYMEHDLAGLVSSPDIKFSESQIKCYMRQLLSGMEHCHLRGIMHRDIKVSNILVNNDGVLKIGDFGLANTLSPNNKNPLTSRVVTLWYRAPELLMGSTNYGVSVDLWSVGCVFAELFLGKPILKGRNEVEQLHRIFKLCGSPPEEFWRKCKLPLATMFKPQTTYESSLWERCKGFPPTAVSLIETLLSIDPSERGTASSALMSEYFSTKPHACSPSLLPKYPPSKEMDAKYRDDAQRKKVGVAREAATTAKRPKRVQKVLDCPNNNNKTATKEEMQNNAQNGGRDDKVYQTKGRIGLVQQKEMQHKPMFDAKSEAAKTNGSHGYSVYSGPAPASGSTGFTWATKRRKDAASTLSDGSRSKISGLDPNFAKGTYDLARQGIDVSQRNRSYTNFQDETHQESFDGADEYLDYDPTEKADSMISTQGNINEDLHFENGMRRGARKSRFG